jgi:hypothetical protein
MSQLLILHGRAIDPTAADHGGARRAAPPFSNTSVRDFHDPFTLDYLTRKLVHLPRRDRQKLASPARLQAVLRASKNGKRALLVAHTFGKAFPKSVQIPLAESGGKIEETWSAKSGL